MQSFSPELLLALHFVKLVAVAALLAGTLGAFVPRGLEDRQRFAYFVAGPGFGLTWSVGWAMAFGGGVSLLAAWIVGAAALSMISLQVVLFCVGKEGRRSGGAAAVAIALLIGAMALMVWKPV